MSKNLVGYVGNQHPVHFRHFEFGESADGSIYFTRMAEHVFPQVASLVLGYSLQVLQIFLIWNIDDMMPTVVLEQLLVVGEQDV